MMKNMERPDGSRPSFLLNSMEGLIQGLKVLFSLGLAVLILVGGVLVLHLSDEPSSEMNFTHRPDPIEPLYQLDLAEQRQFLVLRSRQHILFRHLQSGELLESLPAQPHIVTASKWNAVSQQLILGYGDGRVALMKRGDDWRIKFTGHVHRDDVRAIAVSPDGRLAATGSSDRLCLWDLKRGKLLAGTSELKRTADALQFSPDQKRLVVGSDDGRVQVIQVKNLKVLKTIDVGAAAISKAAFFDKGEKVFAGTMHGEVFVLDITTGKTVWRAPCCRLNLIALAISPDESYAALTDWTDQIHLYSLKTFERIGRFVGHKKPASTVQFSRNGKTLYSSSYDGTVRIWNVDTFTELACYRGTIPHQDE